MSNDPASSKLAKDGISVEASCPNPFRHFLKPIFAWCSSPSQRVGIASGALGSTTRRCAQHGLLGATHDHLPVCTPLFEIQDMGVRESVGVRAHSRMMFG